MDLPPLTEPGTQTPDVRGAQVRVVVADDHPLYRDGIVRALEATGEIAVVGQAADGRRALALIRDQEPDVALLDVSMPVLDGIDVVEALALGGPPVPVVLLSAFTDQPLVAAGLEAGAAAYVTKTADRAEICRVVVAAATPWFAPRHRTSADSVVAWRPDDDRPRLNPREEAVLQLARLGWEPPEMAMLLGIGEKEISRTISRAMTKLGADTLGQALKLADGGPGGGERPWRR